MPLPDKIKNAPNLLPGLEFYYVAFMDLTSSRPLGFGGVGALSWEVIQSYCSHYRLDDDQTEAMHHHMREMDMAYLEKMRKK